MRLKRLVEDDGAVSPVIGVILMVAITVILAAVIASFVLGLGQQTGVSPQASFSVSYESGGGSGGNVTVSHDSGSPVKDHELYLRGSGFHNNGDSWEDYVSNEGSDSDIVTASASGTTEDTTAVVAGDKLEIDASSDYEMSVVWQSNEGDDSNTFIEDSGPDA